MEGLEADAVLQSVAKTLADYLVLDPASFIAAHQNPAPVSIRYNPSKLIEPQLTDPVPWANSGHYLSARPTFTYDPLFHAGAYYVQEASSMFVEQAIKAMPTLQGITALDLCAAPGGKSTHLLSLIGQNSVLVANEVVRQRALILDDNLTRWGHPNVIVTNANPSHFTEAIELFDLVLVDAPCSGEGLLRKDADAHTHWSAQAVQHCAVRQRDVLTAIWPALKPGGHLIYSTCTYNPSENENNLTWACQTLGATSIQIPIQSEWGIVETESNGVFGYRLMPNNLRGEGFFLGMLRKPEEEPAHQPKKRQLKFGPHAELLMDGGWNIDRTLPTQQGTMALSAAVADVLSSLPPSLRIVRTGTHVNTDTNGVISPAHGAALSLSLNQNQQIKIEVDLPTAIGYLRGEPIKATNAKGHALVCFSGHVLGWAKGAGNRWNNLYPAPLRIKDRRMKLDDIVLALNPQNHSSAKNG